MVRVAVVSQTFSIVRHTYSNTPDASQSLTFSEHELKSQHVKFRISEPPVELLNHLSSEGHV